MSRTPDNPPPRYRFADAAAAAAGIRRIRAAARDPDLDLFPYPVADDQDLGAVVDFTDMHRRAGPGPRAAELAHRSLLVEYLRQRDTERHERRLLGVLVTGHQLGAHPGDYGAPMGLHSRQSVYDRRTRLARRHAARIDQRADEGRAREWLNAHRGQLRELAEALVDNRDALLELTTGAARLELLRCIDTAGTLIGSPRVSQELSTALALAVHLLRPGTAARAEDPFLREHIARGLRLLW